MPTRQSHNIAAGLDLDPTIKTNAADLDPTTRPGGRPPGRPRKAVKATAPKRPRGRPRKYPEGVATPRPKKTAKAPQSVAPSKPLQLCNDLAVAAALDLSVDWLRKDRRKARIIPFVQIGTRIKYDLDKVRAALTKMERGGYAFK